MVSYSTEGALKTLLGTLTEVHHGKLKDLKEDLENLKKDLFDKLAGGRARNGQVKVWMKQVRELVYEIEDWIESDSDRETNLVEIEEFKAQIQGARDRCRRYDLLNKVPTSDADISDDGLSKVANDDSGPLWEEKNVLVALDRAKDQLEEHLMSEEKNLKVVCIVGMEGLGKTTIANEIYGKLQGNFECRAVVSVGRRASMKSTLLDILNQVYHAYATERFRREKLDVKEVITELWTFLGTKRYFIIVDDIWSTWAWKVINCALPDAKVGSRVLITTCIADVARACTIHSSDVLYEMHDLSKENSRSLFKRTISVPEELWVAGLEEVADEMLKTCGGMPFAIMVAAGLLYRKFAELGRSKSLEKSTFFPSEKEKYTLSASDQYCTSQGMRNILEMSCDDLSLPVKCCFLYLSVFPENYYNVKEYTMIKKYSCTIKKDRLIRLWVAEGFIPKMDEESLWETGERYFNELVSRRLIQPLFDQHDSQVVGCGVHGVILDFITSLSGPFAGDTIRRLSLDLRNQDEADDTMEASTAHSRVRSLIVLGDGELRMPDLSAFKLVRVLDLEGRNISLNLKSIACLSLLRYFRGTFVSVLLEQIGQLQHLQTLDLRGTGVRKLPASIDRLQKLVSLLGDDLELPDGCQLRNMQDLEELSTINAESRSSRDALLVLGMRRTSKRLRVLGLSACSYMDLDLYTEVDVNEMIMSFLTELRESIVEVMSFLTELQKSNIESLVLRGNIVLPDAWVPSPRVRRFQLTNYLPRVPDGWDTLVHLTHLDIRITEVTTGDLHVLAKLPSLILLKLQSKRYDHRDGYITVSSGFKSLEVAWFRCGAMGLQFAPGGMKKLTRLRLDFRAAVTRRLCGNKFDFGIQFPGYSLAQVYVTINCIGSTFSEVESAEDAIRDQVSRHPKSPSLELIRHHESSLRGIPMGKAAESTS